MAWREYGRSYQHLSFFLEDDDELAQIGEVCSFKLRR